MPFELQGLTLVKEMLIFAIMPMMAIYRLPHNYLSNTAIVGITMINLPQDVSYFASSLQHRTY